ncbi:hypothetical protein [Candidatus Mycolicibacterium alkanivorans]|nr:hypothetical protein [Candidatus Mycolicibacterium alkanivorans]
MLRDIRELAGDPEACAAELGAEVVCSATATWAAATPGSYLFREV